MRTGTRYRIVIRGRLGAPFSRAFDGMELDVRDGLTILEGVVVDQAQLYGLIDRMRDLALELVRVEEVAR